MPTNNKIEFAYEPVVFTKTNRIIGYEQLVRMPGSQDADFIKELSIKQRLELDEKSLETAVSVASLTDDKCIFVNVFPENVLTLAAELSQYQLGNKIALELNEEVPLDTVKHVIEAYPEIWFILDDITRRTDFFDTVFCSEIRQHSLTVKLPFQDKTRALNGEIDLGVFAQRWNVIVEGVESQDLTELSDKGFMLAQGRDLPGQKRWVKGIGLSEIKLNQ